MKNTTLEEVKAMPWPIDEITDLLMQSKASEERNRMGALHSENDKHCVLTTELPTEELHHEKI